MKIIKYSLGQLQANCYFLVKEKECLIIDPADDASFILEEIQRNNLSLIGMLTTHGHFDHIMAAGEIQLSFDVPLYMFKEDMFLVKRLVETANHFLGYMPNIIKPKNIQYFETGYFQISNFKFQIFLTPGHTPGSCCFYLPSEFLTKEGSGNPVIFTGDTLFKQGIGRHDHSYSSKKDLFESLKKILDFPEETIIYPGHGEETILKNEENYLLQLYPRS